MPLPKFILNDETVKNSHGFYLLNSGLILDRFRENPVMLDNHDIDRLIGRWENLRIEGSILTAEAQFDEGTEIGKERKGQVERGFLKGASLGIDIQSAEYRYNPVTDEQDLYVTRSEVFEGSTTPLPSNAGALTLKIYGPDRQQIPDNEVMLHLDKIVKLTINQNQNNMPTNTNPAGNTPALVTLSAEAQVALGLSDGADGAAISAAVIKLHADLAKERTELTQLKAEREAENKTRAENLSKRAVEEGRVNADQANTIVNLAMANYADAEKFVNSLPAKKSLSAEVRGVVGGTAIPAGREKWNLHRWIKEDKPGLDKLKAENPEVYKTILEKV